MAKAVGRQRALQFIPLFVLPVIATAGWTLLAPWLVRRLDPFITSLGTGAPVYFVFAAALAAALCAPMSLIYVTGGAVFGFVEGALCDTLAGALGSLLAFALARSLLFGRVAQALRKRARLDRFERALSEHALWLCMLLRLSPVAPLGPLSYALGSMRVALSAFVITLPAIAPTAFAFAYAGHAARLLFGSNRPRTTWEWGLLAVGLAATAAVAILIVRAAAQALRKHEHKPAREASRA